jgi:hypothetical protein
MTKDVATDRWLTTRDVSVIVGMSARYVQREVEEGRLRARAVGTAARPTLRYRLADVVSWQVRHTRDRGPSEEG